ncbi:PREDICTED: arginine-glutamic acid dipeptide repeats protein-like [Dufourea novaeangliae]|uniref:arginine-glutamic acid dipeptide repeats protein-like n=1 Tax=Dufourea novaeangliae TaxID=178035 RepID=UPI000766FBC6|nr:PREDICTED: arginine-glutamic acid dipeptide repeats protein-like [Dufourea novaeangliae]
MGVHETEEKETLECTMGIDIEHTNERHRNGTADIPEYREPIGMDIEYRDFPEEQIWSPNDEVNEWVPHYVFMARSVLTFVQESLGISNREAMENSCTGYAEQYITDVLHDSEYLPEVALKTFLTKELPQKLVTRWSSTDVELFLEGIARHGKNFANIQREFLPRKDTKEIVDFYYAWKWTEPAKELRNCRSRRRVKRKRRFPSIACIFGELKSPKMITRSVTNASRIASSVEENNDQDRFLRVASSTRGSRLIDKRKRCDRTAIR